MSRVQVAHMIIGDCDAQKVTNMRILNVTVAAGAEYIWFWCCI